MGTIILKVDSVNPDLSEIEKAAALLKAGKLVAFPTDTVYGIGADVFNRAAVRRIFAAKRRGPDKPLQVLIAHRGDLQTIAEKSPLMRGSEVLDQLTSEFWPGPLTLVVPAKEDFPHEVRCGRATVGVRMPANTIALNLIEILGAPVAASSANISGLPDPVSAGEVMEHLGGKVHLILDGGTAPGNVPSTVLDVSVYPPVILRQGKLPAEDLERVLSTVSV
jgi:L-threonylcarbamoyladenylate synthase